MKVIAVISRALCYGWLAMVGSERRLLIAGIVAVLVGLAVVVWVTLSGTALLDDGFREALEGRGRILAADPALRESTIEGVEWVDPADFQDALQGEDPQELLTAMRAANVSGVLVATGATGDDLRGRLRSYRHVEGFAGVYLDPVAALYEPSLRGDLGASADLTAEVARRILEGAPPPRISSFPEPLRRIRNVEVMVLLRDRGRARLWRSARGSSIARALVTAASVARQRWREREQALGGPLDERIRHMRVEVSLLEEDGTLGVTAPAFVERVFQPEHGVAYALPGAWRYLLPDATRTAGTGSAVRAYEQLFRDNALPDDSLRRRDMRFYRLVVTALGEGDDDGISPLGRPGSPGAGREDALRDER